MVSTRCQCMAGASTSPAESTQPHSPPPTHPTNTMADWTVTLEILDEAVPSSDSAQDGPSLGLRMSFSPGGVVASGSAATQARAMIEAFTAALDHATETSMNNYYNIRAGDEVMPTMNGISLGLNLPRMYAEERRQQKSKSAPPDSAQSDSAQSDSAQSGSAQPDPAQPSEEQSNDE